MAFIKTKSIAQLKREIAEQQKKISTQELSSTKTSEKIKLQRQLFELKNQRLIQAGKKAKRLSGRFGRGLLAIGKKAVPIVKKQARLIRDQQLRDDAIARRLEKGKTKKVTRTVTTLVPIGKKKKKLFKKIKVRVKIPKLKKKKTKEQGNDLFSSLDF